MSLTKNGMVSYEQELLNGFARSQANIFLFTPFLVVLAGVLAGTWVGWLHIGVWALITVLCHLLPGVIARRYLADNKENSSTENWRRVFVLAQILVAFSWAYFAILACATCGYELAIIQFSTILVFVAAMSILNHPLGLTALLTVSPPALVLSTKFALTNETAMLTMAGILLASVVFFHVLARRFNILLISALEHSTEKETLIVDLGTEKSISEAARERAEEANLAKSRFLATMSHELRTPLNAILGFSEIMKDEMFGPIGSETYKDYVNDIHNSGTHLLKLINEILDISRIEAGKHELEEKHLNLVKVVDDAQRIVDIKAKQKDITIEVSYHDNLPLVWVDERAIQQIVLNLLSNALKFTPQGGSIVLKVGWTAKGGQYVSIKDSGPGIPEEEIPIVLSSFGQGSIAIKHAEPGTGLGLTIVQALIHMHQGKFELKSKLREGTEAIAYLPADRVSKKVAVAPSIETEMPAELEPEKAIGI